MTTPPRTTPAPELAPPHRYTAALADTIELRWQAAWSDKRAYYQPNPGEPGFDATKPKFFCLDMFPYPSGAGLHVGHPEGYTATDILSRYKRMQGCNVLHPMGWDAFGLPAEQYAIQTGVHPAVTTKQAIENFRRQLRRFGFCYDWSREFGTIDPEYYKWTQWIFLTLYEAWMDESVPGGKARPIADLVREFERGARDVRFNPRADEVPEIDRARTLGAWGSLSTDDKRRIIDSYRLAYRSKTTVNWCPKLGTVLANDEVIDGRSERGGFPVLRKPMMQWMFRITAYAERLLAQLESLDWPSSTKAIQREWIGKSEGAEIEFALGTPTPCTPTVSVGSTTAGTPTVSVGSTTEHGNLIADQWFAHPPPTLTHQDFIPKNPYPPGIHGPVAELVSSRRFLPHLELADATYFVTWRTQPGTLLDERDRAIVRAALMHFDGDRYRAFAAVVMPDHVHWILRPLGAHRLGKIIDDTKQFSARAVNGEHGARGALWMPERFDHIIRDASYLAEFVAYVVGNPVKAGLVDTPSLYDGLFVHGSFLGSSTEGARAPDGDRRGTRLRVFTTRPDTLFGATYMVVAPEHDLCTRVIEGEFAVGADVRDTLRAYVLAAKHRSDVDRQENKDKTGVFTGVYTVNPATGKSIPVWAADYVLMGYGTGAIMAVPAHDERDFAFAEKFGLDIVEVVQASDGGSKRAGCFAGDGIARNSSAPGISLDGLTTRDAKKAILAWLEATGYGSRKVNFKLRDWTFSRQRYWGEPFPIVYDDAGHPYPVAQSHLPVKLPDLADYAPIESEDPQPLLAKAKDWVRTTAGKAGVDPALLPPHTPVTRETNTMPGSAGSSWYFLRYCDAHNASAFAGKQAGDYWMNVDLYLGGSEHAVGHLLYARFWNNALHDLGFVREKEPFQKLFHQGMITSFAYQRRDKTLVPVDMVEERGEGRFIEVATGEPVTQIVAKMSKSLKNVINPDDVIAEYGADTFRLYEMAMGPLDASKPWNPRDISGCFRFLQRAWRLVIDETTGEVRLAESPDALVERALHRLIKKVGDDIERLAFNTAIAAMIEFVNQATAGGAPLTQDQARRFALVLAPFAPHVGEELWDRLGQRQGSRVREAGFIVAERWPVFDPAMLVESEVEIPVAVAGKVRARITLSAAEAGEVKSLEAAALSHEEVKKILAGKSVKKIIAVPGKMVNLVLGD